MSLPYDLQHPPPARQLHVGRVLGGRDRAKGILLLLEEIGGGEERVFRKKEGGSDFAKLDHVLEEDRTKLDKEEMEAVRSDVELTLIPNLLSTNAVR